MIDMGKINNAYAEAEHEAAKNTYLATWLAENGTANQKERAAANMLCRVDVLTALASQAFAPAFSIFDVYSKLNTSDFVCEECGKDVEWTDVRWEKIKINPCCDAQTWESLKRMRGIFQEAIADVQHDVELRKHRGTADCGCDEHPLGVAERLGIFVKLRIGPFTLKQEFNAARRTA